MGLKDFLLGEGSGRERGEKRGLINQERESNQLYGDATIEAIRRGNEAKVGGYDQAISTASDISRSSRREAITRGDEMQGTLATRYGAGGKFGTTALDNARLGLQSNLTADLEDIDSKFAGLMSELSIGRGGAVSQGEDKLAAFQQDRAGQESELYRLLAGTIKPTQGGALSGVLGAVGAGVGTAFGGPAGGAMGGELGSALGGSFERT